MTTFLCDFIVFARTRVRSTNDCHRFIAIVCCCRRRHEEELFLYRFVIEWIISRHNLNSKFGSGAQRLGTARGHIGYAEQNNAQNSIRIFYLSLSVAPLLRDQIERNIATIKFLAEHDGTKGKFVNSLTRAHDRCYHSSMFRCPRPRELHYTRPYNEHEQWTRLYV